jgi:hypothetical protein
LSGTQRAELLVLFAVAYSPLQRFALSTAGENIVGRDGDSTCG